MISGVPGFLLNVVSIILMSAIVVIGLISLAIELRLWRSHWLCAEARQTGLWLMVIAPWLIGFGAATIVMVLSIPGTATMFNNGVIHWHHPAEFYLNSWHGYFVLGATGFACLICLRVIRRLWLANDVARTLASMSQPEEDGVRILDAETPAAFTAGIIQPRCYMTRALLEALEVEEYAIIRLHELKHVQRRDPFRKSLFQLLTGFFPSRVAKSMNAHLAMAMEQSADTAVTDSFPDRALIARALIKVRRLALNENPFSNSLPVLCHFGLDNVEQRIHYLLRDDKGAALPMLIVFIVMLVLAALAALGLDSIHHTIEFSMQHPQ